VLKPASWASSHPFRLAPDGDALVIVRHASQRLAEFVENRQAVHEIKMLD